MLIVEYCIYVKHDQGSHILRYFPKSAVFLFGNTLATSIKSSLQYI